jgi:hypothetical protein
MDPNEDPELIRVRRKAIDEYLTSDPERRKANMEEMHKFIGTLGGMMTVVAALAAPRYLATGNPEKVPTPEKPLRLIDDYLVLLDGWKLTPNGDPNFLRTEDARAGCGRCLRPGSGASRLPSRS